MITTQVYQYNSKDAQGNDLAYIEGACLSTDTKPTEGIANGSKLMEMDTATLYMWDASGQQWLPWE